MISRRIPYVDPSLLKKIEKAEAIGRKNVKTYSRRSTIIPKFIGFIINVHNGKKFVPVTVDERMLGRKLGEFSPTRTFTGHT